MQKPETFSFFIKPLETVGIGYMVTGAVAAIVYGEPRLTHDIDLVIDLKPDKIEVFHDSYKKEAFYVPPIEVLRVEAARSYRGHFNLIHHKTGFKADIYLKGEDELHKWAFKNLEMEKIDDYKAAVAPIEYVIIRKLMYFEEGHSQKHLDDIRHMLYHNKDGANLNKIQEFVNKYNLSQIWKLI